MDQIRPPCRTLLPSRQRELPFTSLLERGGASQVFYGAALRGIQQEMIITSSLTNKSITLNSENDVHYIAALIAAFIMLYRVRHDVISNTKDSTAVKECLIDTLENIRNCAEYSKELLLQFMDKLAMTDPDNIKFVSYSE